MKILIECIKIGVVQDIPKYFLKNFTQDAPKYFLSLKNFLTILWCIPNYTYICASYSHRTQKRIKIFKKKINNVTSHKLWFDNLVKYIKTRNVILLKENYIKVKFCRGQTHG